MSAHEIVKAKFSSTIAAIESVVNEAEGDVEVGTKYSPEAVLKRALKIKAAFENDMNELAEDIVIAEPNENPQP